MVQGNEIKSESNLTYYGWLVVAMAILANLSGFGLVYAFSVFFVPLSKAFGWSRAALSGAFSFYAVFHTILAFFTGSFADRFGPRIMMIVAGLSLGLSMMLMYFVNTIFEFYLYYGILFSVGIACVYAPIMSTVSRWFNAKRGLAMGLSAAGLGAGSMIFSPLSAWLIQSFGWKNSYVILGVLTFIIYIPVVCFIKAAPVEVQNHLNGSGENQRGLSFFQAFKTSTFWAFCMSWTLIALPLWSILVHIVPLATDRGVSMIAAGSLAGLIGGSSLVGRVSAGFLSDKFGRKRVLISAFSLQLIPTVWLLIAEEPWMLFVFAVVFGLSTGSWAGTIPAFPADLFGHKATGAILGFTIVLAGISIAVGPYLGGYIFDVTQSYQYMIIMCILVNIAAVVSAGLIKPVESSA